MKQMGLNELREAYLHFFEEKGHLRMPSFSLIPKDDKGLLLINAGMAPLKPYFTGLKTPPRKRVTTCQKCVRTIDIDNVGHTSRHATLFEMLGNFSFGDYFKNEVIPWAWEFVTEVLQIPKDKLYVTIHLNDDEAYEIWTSKTDIDPKRIFRLGEDNFWEIGVGPCGPCSEIHYDKGAGKITTSEEFEKASDADKVIEFWNLVFTQFDKDEEGNYNKLAHPNIDTGMGLERIATIMQGVDSIFDIDTIRSIVDEVANVAGKEYGKDKLNDISIRIVTDHIKAVTFLIADGVLPSNEGRGYVLRRLLRRAARHGRLLGIKGLFLKDLVNKVIENYGDAYPELREKEDYIKKVISIEEERFNETIDSGMDILKLYIEDLKAENKKELPGEKAFKLYDTYGFPLELTDEIIQEQGLSIDIDGFNKEMELQKKRAREAREENTYMGGEESIVNKIPKDIETKFMGYETLKCDGTVKAIISGENFSDALENGEAIIVTDKTPFYAEMGGQIGDAGFITNENFKGQVLDCKKNINGKVMHVVKVIKGSVMVGDVVSLEVNSMRRRAICKNHSATHMLQEALKEVLGNHVNQSGSYVDDERLRFDFTHFSPLTIDELKRVEMLVNEKIMEAYNVHTDIMSIEDAKASGAVALFDDKYKNEVRVVSIGDFSKELCGGTHVKNSGEIGLFRIISESGVAAGIRRIEAATGMNAIKEIECRNEILKDAAKALKCSEKDIVSRIASNANELKEKEKEINVLKSKLVSGIEDEIIKGVKEVNGVKYVTYSMENVDANSLRNIGDKVKNKLGEGVIVLASNHEGKVSFISMATKEAVLRGAHAGKIIKEVAAIAGGGGGGRPDMAQAGGKKPEKIDEALQKVSDILMALLK